MTRPFLQNMEDHQCKIVILNKYSAVGRSFQTQSPKIDCYRSQIAQPNFQHGSELPHQTLAAANISGIFFSATVRAVWALLLGTCRRLFWQN